ncbi:hypothetical protein [Dawidia soli]|uniref:Lipocalin-like domain-containing protein n=1 Tax=Dawidia soli TaxID=2782352 RepID=A0AAP2GJ49_9BACT|nr:hypothetical protein [Dawidia soli]MBT1688115.1 hypothetical protein [Dawidia soli]
MNAMAMRLCSVCCVLFLLAFTACNNDNNEPGEEALQRKKLVGTWTVGETGSVKRDDVTLSGWDTFELTMGEQTYQTSNASAAVWPAQGTWKLVTGDVSKVERDDDVILTVNVSGETLQISFQYGDDAANGRAASIAGSYVFNLIKN